MSAPATTLRCLYCGHGRQRGGACASCRFEPPRLPCHACGRFVVEVMEQCACGEPRVAWSAEATCPRCRYALARVPVYETAAYIDACGGCGGSFVRTEDLGDLFLRTEAGKKLIVPNAPGDAARQEPDRLEIISCPHCMREMDRARFAQRASLVVDVCTTHGMWLDRGELEALLAFVGERTAGVVAPGAIERADEEKWKQIMDDRAKEERAVNDHLWMAEYYNRRNEGSGGGD